MYEQTTYETILQRMLNRVSDNTDKREGSLIFDALSPVAIELQILYLELDNILNQTFADTASGEYLERRCAERGITRKSATYAVVQGEFTPANIDVTGCRFNCGQYHYTVNSGSNGVYELICETSGTEPNNIIGTLMPIDYVNGLKTAKITTILIPGEAEETDDNLRERYYATLNSQAFGGNIADYIEKTNGIDGVGGVKVTPAWNGGGSVKLTIIASDYTIPTNTLVDHIQTLIDPLQNQGKGNGIAPIGHVVTVEGVAATAINIVTNITYQDGWNFEASKPYIEKAVDAYFLELSKEWAASDNLVVRISAIETRLLACAGVLDVADTTLNGLAGNIQLESSCIPVRGDIVG